ncbi:MAG: hypothetical protein WCV67_19165 [Victivallaceae bacterium]
MRRVWWTWDIRMHWDHGFSFSDESYLGNYRQAVDAAKRYGVEAIVIWGFLREVHGGTHAAHKLLDYARSRGVEVYPGFGVDSYGGAFYQGDSPYSLDSFIERYPEAQAIDQDGKLRSHRWPMNDFSARKTCCPSYQPAMDFYFRAVEWIMREFDLKGIQIEQGDCGHCYCQRCQETFLDTSLRSDMFDLNISRNRLLPVINRALDIRPDLTVIVETYSGMEPEKIVLADEQFRSYPESVFLSWQAYNGFAPRGERFLLNAKSRSPRTHGCLAVRANGGAGLGESEDIDEIIMAVNLGKAAGLDMSYIYGEYPDQWPKTRKVYNAWSQACADDVPFPDNRKKTVFNRSHVQEAPKRRTMVEHQALVR